ncbi:hypothetical protein IWX46DRAFT_243741 [Phyllosticta citricarpa]|uniref:Secreted protein n=1 Tax=Phyllosticta citricarpa TaxID=55181 RepID=A0ABR1LRS1_9PEZI
MTRFVSLCTTAFSVPLVLVRESKGEGNQFGMTVRMVALGGFSSMPHRDCRVSRDLRNSISTCRHISSIVSPKGMCSISRADALLENEDVTLIIHCQTA